MGKFSNLIPSGEMSAEGTGVREFVCRFRAMETSKMLTAGETWLRWWFRTFHAGISTLEDPRE
jgi:hypothetical protein